MTGGVVKLTGHYDQAKLEALSDPELREVRDWAGEEFAVHLRDHGDSDEYCERCEYVELLQGAAGDILLDRHTEDP